MAGAGFKTFNTGDVLTAADVNTFLMQQTVMVFADSAARTTALGANEAEGMLTYLKDTDTTEYYTGSAWVALAADQTPLTTKGDLFTYSTTDARLPVGTNGQYLQADSTTATGLKWASSSALSWNEGLAPLGASASFRVNAIASDGSAFVAVGENGYLYESSNGSTWTSRTSGFGANDIDSVVFGNGIWVAVGQNGTISTSTDRVTWTTRTSNMSTNNINYVAYINSNFVAVGDGGGTTNTGGVTYSSDGITWTRVNQSLTVGSNYQSVIWNGTNYIVGSATSTNNYIYSATLGGTWTAALATGASISALYYDGTTTIYATGTGFRYTTGTTLASTTAVSNFSIASGDNHTQIYLYSGKLYYSKYGFITSISTTVSASGYLANTAAATPQPGTAPITGGSLSNDNNCIWVGSQGIIIGGLFGQLYTNF